MSNYLKTHREILQALLDGKILVDEYEYCFKLDSSGDLSYRSEKDFEDEWDFADLIDMPYRCEIWEPKITITLKEYEELKKNKKPTPSKKKTAKKAKK